MGAAQVYHPSNIACRTVHSNLRNPSRAKHHLPAPCSRPPSPTHRRKAQGRPRAATPDMVVAGVARANHQLKTALSIRPQIHPPRSRERNQNGRSFGQMQVACPAPNAPTQRTSMADPSKRTHHSPQGRRVDRIFGVSGSIFEAKAMPAPVIGPDGQPIVAAPGAPPVPGSPVPAQTPAPPAAPAGATPFKGAPERANGEDGEGGEVAPGEGDFDDDDMENSLSLAAIEAELKPKVVETFDNIADAYKRLRRLQDQDIQNKLRNDSLSPAQERRYKKLKDDIISEVKSLRLNQARIDALVEQLYDIN